MTRRARRSLIGLAGALFGIASLSPTASGQLWSREFDHPAWILGNAIEQTADGEFVIAGETSDGFSQTAVVLRTDAAGNVLWEKCYDGDGNPKFKAIVELLDGNFVACGQVEGDPWLVKVDATDGTALWELAVSSNGALNSAVATPDGGVLAVGQASSTEFLGVKVDSDGQIEWQKRFEMSGSGTALAVVPMSGGKYAIAGENGTGADRVLLVVQIDGFGVVQWSRTFAEDDLNPLFNTSIAADIAGGLVLASGREDVCVMRLDSAGVISWQHRYGDSEIEQSEWVIATRDGGSLVAGSKDGDAWMLKLDSTGAIEWQNRSGAAPAESFRHGVQTDGGGFAFCGVRGIPFDLYAVRVDSDGLLGDSCPEIGPTSAPRSGVTVTEADVTVTAVDVSGAGRSTSSTITDTALLVNETCSACPVRFEEFGDGLAGSGGFIPHFFGTDGSCTGDGRAITLTEGLGGAFAYLWVGVAEADLPFAGGRLYIDLANPWLLIPFPLSGPSGVPGAGFFHRVGSTDLTPFLGLTVILQFTVLDAGAPRNIAFSNGLRLIIGDS